MSKHPGLVELFSADWMSFLVPNQQYQGEMVLELYPPVSTATAAGPSSHLLDGAVRCKRRRRLIIVVVLCFSSF